MLDKRSITLLKALNKLTDGATYKVITSEDIMSALPNKSQYDADGIKHIIDFLEKQEYINIKFSEESTYCYSLLPKARIYLEQEGSKTQRNKKKSMFLSYLYVGIASFIGSMLAIVLFFYLLI